MTATYKRNLEWLKSKGMTPLTFAFALQTDPSNVHHWLHGRRPRSAWQRLIAAKFPDAPFVDHDGKASVS